VPEAGVQLRADVVVPEAGDDREPGPWLVAASSATAPLEWRQYAPLDRGELHRRWAKLESDQAIEKFANQYGLLGHAEAVAVPPRGIIRRGESIGRWRREVLAMRELIGLWDVVKQRRPGEKGAEPEQDRLRVYKTVNDRLKGHVDSVSHPDLGGEILQWPDCLLAALYLLLQFDLAAWSARPVHCKYCDGDIKGEKTTRRRQYCTDNHRVLYAYHHRNDRQARQQAQGEER